MNIKTVIVLKNKDGTDFLGYSLGEVPQDEGKEKQILLFKPIMIIPVWNMGMVVGYTASLHFPYGCGVVAFPESNVSMVDNASPFFELFYTRSLGRLTAQFDIIENKILESYMAEDIREVMSETDSVFVDVKTPHLQ